MHTRHEAGKLDHDVEGELLADVRNMAGRTHLA